jgi:hypothetical protein
MQIDQDERRHSHLYELKPMSPWLLLPPLAMLVLSVLLNGLGRVETWGLIVGSGLFCSLLPMVFPRQLLSRPKD